MNPGNDVRVVVVACNLQTLVWVPRTRAATCCRIPEPNQRVQVATNCGVIACLIAPLVACSAVGGGIAKYFQGGDIIV